MGYKMDVHFASHAHALAAFALCGACALIFVSAPAYADYGELPPQPGDPEYIPERITLRAPNPTPTKPSPIDWEIAATADFLTAPIRGGTNPFGLGFGGRAGLSVYGVYAGFTVIDYLGGTDVNQSDRSILIGGELGYGAKIHTFERERVTLVLRGVVGLGNASVAHDDPALAQNVKPDVVTTASGRTVSGSKPSTTVSVNDLFLRPTLSLMLVHDWQFVALQGDALVLPRISYGGADPSTWISYGAQVQIGAKF